MAEKEKEKEKDVVSFNHPPHPQLKEKRSTRLKKTNLSNSHFSVCL